MNRKKNDTEKNAAETFDKNRAFSGSDRHWDEEPLYHSPRHWNDQGEQAQSKATGRPERHLKKHPENETYSISELAKLFGITTRTIRYYEELGLLHPKRTEGGQRIFSKREKTRLRLIFRGKKYGFSLDEIREMIGLFDVDPTGKKQLSRTIEYGKEKIEEVTERINELVTIRKEMEKMLADFEDRLNETEDK
jgi:DNA-binding transcriptional MerR regulator